MNKFETVYKFAREYVQSCTREHKDLSTLDNRRSIMRAFKHEVHLQIGNDVNTNTWLFDQNELKTEASGKQSLKSLCESYYYEAVGCAS